MTTELRRPAILALEDGTVFRGISIGSAGCSAGEAVFNTAMSGYQEILTDPGSAGQIVTLTYPQIGNTGVNPEDEESDRVWTAALVVRDLPLLASNFRSEGALSDYLAERGVVAIAGIDTRRLTRILREKGTQNACVLAGEIDEAAALAEARAFSGPKGKDLTGLVSTTTPYSWSRGSWMPGSGHRVAPPVRSRVVVCDYGVRRSLLRALVDHGFGVTVMPAAAPAAEVLALQPDGVILAGGPGDPEACVDAVRSVRELLDARIPVMGIGLGHQLLGLASGARSMKLRRGHHGANHPVQQLDDGTVTITGQNHGFVLDETTLPATLRITHRSLFDDSLQGIERTDCPAFGFQGCPETRPGRRGLSELFDRFAGLMLTRCSA